MDIKKILESLKETISNTFNNDDKSITLKIFEILYKNKENIAILTSLIYFFGVSFSDT